MTYKNVDLTESCFAFIIYIGKSAEKRPLLCRWTDGLIVGCGAGI